MLGWNSAFFYTPRKGKDTEFRRVGARSTKATLVVKKPVKESVVLAYTNSATFSVGA